MSTRPSYRPTRSDADLDLHKVHMSCQQEQCHHDTMQALAHHSPLVPKDSLTFSKTNKWALLINSHPHLVRSISAGRVYHDPRIFYEDQCHQI
jgi:hypothetical protein